jgi:hypothetical protein
MTAETEPAPLTNAEKRAICALKRLAKRWPSSLWLFSAGGSLWVMRSGPRGEHVTTDGPDGAINSTFIVDQIDGISNDGGDF